LILPAIRLANLVSLLIRWRNISYISQAFTL
jgi:hypothetical protein